MWTNKACFATIGYKLCVLYTEHGLLCNFTHFSIEYSLEVILQHVYNLIKMTYNIQTKPNKIEFCLKRSFDAFIISLIQRA